MFFQNNSNLQLFQNIWTLSNQTVYDLSENKIIVGILSVSVSSNGLNILFKNKWWLLLMLLFQTSINNRRELHRKQLIRSKKGLFHKARQLPRNPGNHTIDVKMAKTNRVSVITYFVASRSCVYVGCFTLYLNRLLRVTKCANVFWRHAEMRNWSRN